MLPILLSFTFALVPPLAPTPAPQISGDYLEVRSCDVFTGPCFANAEVNEVGKEATLAWKVRTGKVGGVDLAGLSVVAVVKSDTTLGDPYHQPTTRTALLFDDTASSPQRAALKQLALERLGALAGTVVDETSVPIDMKVGCCDEKGCADLSAGEDVAVATRCLGAGDHVCGNESVFYPPLTDGVNAIPAYATENSVACADVFGGDWSLPNNRGAFVGAFAATLAIASSDDDTAKTPAPQDKPAAASADSGYALIDAPEDAAAIPSEVNEAIRALLERKAHRLTKDGTTLHDFWLVKEVALAGKPDTGAGIKFGQIAPGAIIGVLRAEGVEADYRKEDIKKGVYLLRYAIQPNNGNHLGTADTRDFVVLTGPEDDTDVAPIDDVDKLVEQSLIVSPSDHAQILYLREPNGDVARPALVKHAERDEWLADLDLGAPEGKKIRIGLVLVGISPHP